MRAEALSSLDNRMSDDGLERGLGRRGRGRGSRSSTVHSSGLFEGGGEGYRFGICFKGERRKGNPISVDDWRSSERI